MSLKEPEQRKTRELLAVLITDMSSDDLCQAVAPEEAAEHYARLLLVPVEVGAQGDGADGHGDAGAVQQARPQQQHHRPDTGLRPAGVERKMRKGQMEWAAW